LLATLAYIPYTTAALLATLAYIPYTTAALLATLAYMPYTTAALLATLAYIPYPAVSQSFRFQLLCLTTKRYTGDTLTPLRFM
jgi:hypothetical protein